MLTTGFFWFLLAGELAAIIFLVLGITSKIKVIRRFGQGHQEEPVVQGYEQNVQ